MAMNKAEKAALDLALTVASFYRTVPVERDLPPPTDEMRRMEVLPPGYGRAQGAREAWRNGEIISMGWDFNSYSPRAEKACSGYISHNFGDWNGTSSQQPRTLYSTKLKALRAMRHAIEMETCLRLRTVDRMIEAELANPTPGPDAQ